jgi:hypothetical protein
MSGKEIPVNFLLAAELFQRVADQDDPDKANGISYPFEHGESIDRNLE